MFGNEQPGASISVSSSSVYLLCRFRTSSGKLEIYSSTPPGTIESFDFIVSLYSDWMGDIKYGESKSMFKNKFNSTINLILIF